MSRGLPIAKIRALQVSGRALTRGTQFDTKTYTGNATTNPGDIITLFSNRKSEFEIGYIEHGDVGQSQSKIEVQESSGNWYEIVDADQTNRWDVSGVHYGARLRNGANHSDYSYKYDLTVQPLEE